MNETELFSKLDKLKTVDDRISFLEKTLSETEDENLKKKIGNLLLELRKLKEKKPEEVVREDEGIESLVSEVPSAPVIPEVEMKLENYKAPVLEETAEETAEFGLPKEAEVKREDTPGYLSKGAGEPYMKTEAAMRAELDRPEPTEEEKALAEYLRQKEEERMGTAIDTTERMMSKTMLSRDLELGVQPQDFRRGDEYIHKEEGIDTLDAAREFEPDKFIKERDLIAEPLKKYKRKDM